jgi:hypothetical protein
MAIPESQLTTWSSQGSVTQSKNTYATVKNALEASNALYVSQSYSVFLQGSYENDTNIYADSDVDTVIRLDSIFRGDISQLPADQRSLYQQLESATYTFAEFKQDVHTRLINAFGANEVTLGDRAFHIKPNSSRRSADVVACHQYRRYIRFNGVYDQEYVTGIIIPGTSKGDIINYPKLHSENLTAKHQSTNSWLKPTIRIFKNMRNKLIDDGVIADDTACSYYIEGMLYNVPDDKFGGSYGDTFCNALNWLRQTDRSKLICPNRQYWLLGNSNVQWTTAKCDQFLNALAALWNNWGK